MPFRAIDVFAGGGGLTVGLKRAGFDVVAAIESEKHAYATYKANHPEVHALKQDVSTVCGKDLLDLIGEQKIELLAGCPPCQGFTSLTAKYRRDDRRNVLVLEMARLAEELQPTAIMMENVPRLARKGKGLYSDLRRRLEGLGYVLTEGILKLLTTVFPNVAADWFCLADRGSRSSCRIRRTPEMEKTVWLAGGR